MNKTAQPFSILIAALGGEGGGVLAEWIVQAALKANLAVQATSVPGVAQRTGATSYYIEFFPEPLPAGQHPVFALMPVPGRLDVLLASELLEAARIAERGFITPQRTLLISADHRVLTTAEKMAMGDGRLDDAPLRALLHEVSRRSLVLDLNHMATRHGTVISSVLFGALAGSGSLPWPRALCEAVITEGGLGVNASLAGFGQAFDAASADLPAAAAPGALPAELAEVLALGQARMADYQDRAYAATYAERVQALQRAGHSAPDAVLEAARQLALWMSYEDVIRVADLKTRAERLQRVRNEAGAKAGELVQIREHLKPGLAELADIAPARLGRWLRARIKPGLPVGARGRGLTLHTTSVSGFVALRLLAALRRFRRASLRFVQEQAAIEAWHQAMLQVLLQPSGFARHLAELPRLRKGYSDTFERGRAAYERIFAQLVLPHLSQADDAAAQALQQAIAAALADPEHQALDRHLGNTATQRQHTPIRWHPRVSKPADGPAAGP